LRTLLLKSSNSPLSLNISIKQKHVLRNYTATYDENVNR
jgi:hypothetical protein